MDTCIKILSFVFSLAALGLSAYAASNQYYADIPTTVLSVVGICATLIVGISVVDAFAVHSALHRTEEKMNELSQKMEELALLEGEVCKMRKQTNILFHHTWGLSFKNHQPYLALAEFWKAFELTVVSKDVKRAKSCIINALEVADEIKQRKENGGKLDEPDMSLIPTETPVAMKNTDVYCVYENDIKKLIDTIKSIT